ncbi:unnamed protein product, partial [Lampetra fluviatilis]
TSEWAWARRSEKTVGGRDEERNGSHKGENAPERTPPRRQMDVAMDLWRSWIRWLHHRKIVQIWLAGEAASVAPRLTRTDEIHKGHNNNKNVTSVIVHITEINDNSNNKKPPPQTPARVISRRSVNKLSFPIDFRLPVEAGWTVLQDSP